MQTALSLAEATLTSRPSHIPPDEWLLRVQLAACYRIFAYQGWTELIYNHITVRLPGARRHFLINAFGLHYSEVCASNLVKIDIDGNKVDQSEWLVNPAGFTIHAAIHRTIEQAHCVMHTHTTAGTAVACLKNGLSMSNFYALQLYDKVSYHDFEGITVHAEEGPRLLASLGNRQALILRNHGLLSWGNSVAQAFNILYLLNRACEVQVATAPMGECIVPNEDVQRRCTEDSLQFSPTFGAGQDVVDALTRIVDRLDPSYKT